MDREGREEPLPMPARPYWAPRVSPDGRQIVTSLESGSGYDLWVYDVVSGAGIRLTEDSDINWIPMYAPDGQRIFFSSTTDAPRPESFTGAEWYGNVYSVPGDGSSEAQRLTNTEENQALSGISPDGQALIYSKVIENATRWEIMTMPSDGSGEAVALVSGPTRRGSGIISRDGKWLAYRSDESGDWEIYVQPFPGPGAKVPVSIGGGIQPVWSQDGRELFYRGAGGTMMAATITGDVAARSICRSFRNPHQKAKSSRWTGLMLGARFLDRLRTKRCCLRRRFSAMSDLEPPGWKTRAMVRNK